MPFPDWHSAHNDIDLEVTLIKAEYNLICDICNAVIQPGQRAYMTSDYDSINWAHADCVNNTMPCPTCEGRGFLFIEPVAVHMIVNAFPARRTVDCPECERNRYVAKSFPGTIAPKEII